MAKANKANDENENNLPDELNGGAPVCGIVMPIANTAGYPDGHWTDVYGILCEVAKKAGFDPCMVSFDEDIGVIHKRIIHNLYKNPIVVCDISSRNANVMFELGMRLAFDKPTIIIKDKVTPFSFDISSIEHLEYPSDLRYQSINEFKSKLESKIKKTYRRSQSEPEYSTFLKDFGTFTVSRLDEKEASFNEVLLEEFKELKKSISMQINRSNHSRGLPRSPLGDIANATSENSLAFGSDGLGGKLSDILEAMIELKGSHGVEIPSLRKVNDDLVIMTFDKVISPEHKELIKEAMVRF
ncbi:hypothetical protein IMX17_09190 [Serratia sp. X3]|uniref:hypothetical protein n=1 Tax=Serratia sp. X3 TaxID=2780495 RepID=UPI001876C422|nr:hypothetical protein [Serratia sp. X3]MBE4973567.1 hypothetical protein [Serratia sp. X3]